MKRVPRRLQGIRALVLMVPILWVAVGCSRTTSRDTRDLSTSHATDSAAIVRDAPERIVMPLAPQGAGQVVVERVSVARVTPAEAPLDLAPPAAEPGEPPALAARANVPDTV